ncbi:MAG: VCBS repeat-containing protein [Proteobacteria bacterium]|nr:VCBS repeat-containing protein [Pseudomonadota bacterium]
MARQIEPIETLIRDLADELERLHISVMDLRLPGPASIDLFEPTAVIRDLAMDTPPSLQRVAGGLASQEHWAVARQARPVHREDLRLWSPLLDQVRYFEHAEFYIIDLEFGRRGSAMADMGFAAVGRSRAGEYIEVEAEFGIEWTRGDLSGGVWRIGAWLTERLRVERSRQRFFAEVLDRAIADRTTRERARFSAKEQLIEDLLTDRSDGRSVRSAANETRFNRRTEPPYRDFSFHSAADHPGLAVVDIDRDGLDDLYFMPGWPEGGDNMLLRNRGDGTFVDIAPELGLALRGFFTSAVFADFDNDGDVDAFLGQTRAPSIYLINRDGRFADRSKSAVRVPLPPWVTSMSVADYDRDGLLDVFFATYFEQPAFSYMAGAYGTVREKLERYYDSDTVTALMAQYQRRRLLTDQPGPANLLLRNIGGGRFDVGPGNDSVGLAVNSFQGAWADFDDDGDQDLFVANDFAPNSLFRNSGDGRFTEVAASLIRGEPLGFSMGASWGDYDNDGRVDLYVTNMYSKAGRRLANRLGPGNHRIRQMSSGNALLRQNRDGSFEVVSGLAPPALPVARAGWGWGGQFVDIDNDGFLDIYSMAGFYTAPKAVQSDVDT